MQRAFLNTADTMLCDSPNSRTTTCCVSKIRVIKLTFSLFPAAHPHKHTELSHPQTFSFCLPLLHFWLFFVDCRVSKKKNIHLYSVNTCSDTVSSKRWGQKGWIFLNYFSYCDAAAAGCCIIRTLGFYAFQKFNTSELYTQLFSFIFSLSLSFSRFNSIESIVTTSNFGYSMHFPAAFNRYHCVLLCHLWNHIKCRFFVCSVAHFGSPQGINASNEPICQRRRRKQLKKISSYCVSNVFILCKPKIYLFSTFV